MLSSIDMPNIPVASTIVAADCFEKDCNVEMASIIRCRRQKSSGKKVWFRSHTHILRIQKSKSAIRTAPPLTSKIILEKSGNSKFKRRYRPSKTFSESISLATIPEPKHELLEAFFADQKIVAQPSDDDIASTIRWHEEKVSRKTKKVWLRNYAKFLELQKSELTIPVESLTSNSTLEKSAESKLERRHCPIKSFRESVTFGTITDSKHDKNKAILDEQEILAEPSVCVEKSKHYEFCEPVHLDLIPESRHEHEREKVVKSRCCGRSLLSWLQSSLLHNHLFNECQ